MKIVKKIGLGILVVLVLLVGYIAIGWATMPSAEPDLSKLEIAETVDAETTQANKDLAVAYYESLYTAEYASQMDEYLAEGYVEHQHSAGYTQDGIADYIQDLLNEYPEMENTVLRVIAQGDLVFLHVESKLSSSKSVARGELFRIADGKITEHWSAEQEVPENALESRKMFNGSMPDYSSTAGEEYTYKSVIAAHEAWVNFNIKSVQESTTDRYVNHNPQAPDGGKAFVNVIRLFKTIRVFNGQVNLQVTSQALAEGNFIVTQTIAGTAEAPQTAFDILMVVEDGKKDEHWDIIESITPEDIPHIH